MFGLESILLVNTVVGIGIIPKFIGIGLGLAIGYHFGIFVVNAGRTIISAVVFTVLLLVKAVLLAVRLIAELIVKAARVVKARFK